MITPYVSQQPVDDFGIRFADLLYSADLDAATDTALTIPGNAPKYKALIKAGLATDGESGALIPSEVWVAQNATAAVPAGASFAVTTSELITLNYYICREVRAGDVLHFYATSGGTVSVVLYAVGTNN